MTDLLAWRKKFGVITPSVNTVVQPEYDDMRPPGVTNHIGRMYCQDVPHRSDADMNETVREIDAALERSVMDVMTCRPDAIVLGISGESIWGKDQSRNIARRIADQAGGIPVTQATDALPAALKALGIQRRIAVISPYFSTGQGFLQEFWDATGYEMVRAAHINAASPVQIAHATRPQLNAAIREIDGDDIEAIVQFGANLPFGRIAAEAEHWIGKPVIAVNTATYWHALRTNGIEDRMQGFGRLMAEH